MHPEPLRLPESPWHAKPDSDNQLANEMCIWMAAFKPQPLEPPLLIAVRQDVAEDTAQHEMLLGLPMRNIRPLAMPKEDEQPSLAQLWSADAIMEQHTAMQLPMQPLQPLPLEQHGSYSVENSAAWQLAQGNDHELPHILMRPTPGSAEVMQRMLASSATALSLPEAGDGDVAHGLTFDELVAPGQVLCNHSLTLPPVHIEDRSANSLAALHASVSIAQSIRAKPLSLAAMELLLDWSLKDPEAPDPSKRLQQVGRTSACMIVPF